jgi:hypothetical protein
MQSTATLPVIGMDIAKNLNPCPHLEKQLTLQVSRR